MEKTRLTKITYLILIAFILLVFATVLAGRSDWRYVLSEITRLPDNSLLPKELTYEETDIRNYTFQEICNNKRIDFSDSLMLINEEYPLPSDYIPELILYGETEHKININITESFEDLVNAVKENCGQDLRIVSSHRTKDEQLQTIKEEGEKAADVNASEHLTGLSLDVCVQYFGGKSFLKSNAGKFVNDKCGEYGFIIRYPIFSKKVTGIGYEPWHIRYVGFPHSKIIQGAKLTLEEYIKYLEIGKFYRFEEYIITRQPKANVRLPKKFVSAHISEDNTGCYIITLRV